MFSPYGYDAYHGAGSMTDGAVNTALLAAFGESNFPAAFACANLTLGGYDDWYLPANNELVQLYQARSQIGGFQDVDYWASTEHPHWGGWSYGYYLQFANGYNSYWQKYAGFRVRCVRKAN
jgi:hypothetical protein